MYPITRESVMAAISSSVAENAVCWCDGRKKRRRRIFCRLTHLAAGGRVIGGDGIGNGNLGLGRNAEERSQTELICDLHFIRLPQGGRLVRDENRSLVSSVFLQSREIRAGGGGAGPQSNFP